jgi:hypothetical protein
MTDPVSKAPMLAGSIIFSEPPATAVVMFITFIINVSGGLFMCEQG